LDSLFGVVDAARGGVIRPCSSFSSSLQNNKEKGDFFFESIHCRRPDDRRSGIVPRFLLLFIFFSFFG
jgi:hypothetical protein